MLLPRCPECKTDVTLAQLRASDAVRCSSLCRRAYHTSCVALPDDVLKLLLNPNILWQCDSCVVANDSHSKIDEFDEKLKALERLYQGLQNKFMEAFPPKDDALHQNVNPKPRLPRPTNVAAAPLSYAAAAATASAVVDPSNHALDMERGNFIQVRNKRRRNNNKPNKHVVGVAPNAEDLHVLPTKKFLHVGKFATDTEPNAVLKYVSTKLKVDASSLTCAKLVKKDVDVQTLKFVNFKLGIPDQLYDIVFKNDFWPNSVKVKRFIHRERATVVGDGILSNLPEPGQTSSSSQPSKNP